MMGFTPLQALAHALEDLCARCTSDPGARTPEAANLLVEGGSLLIELIRHAATTPPPPEATADYVARVGQLLEATATVDPDRREADRREGDRRQHDRRDPAPVADASAVRIDFRLLDTMLEIFGESMIDHAALHDAHRRLLQRLGASPELSDLDRTLLSLDSTMKRFENALMRTRMLPVSTVFGRFTRLVRDVARSERKRVRLVASGRRHAAGQDRAGSPGRAAGASPHQRDRARHRVRGRSRRRGQAGRGVAGAPGGADLRPGGDHGVGQRTRSRPRADPGQGRGARARRLTTAMPSSSRT